MRRLRWKLPLTGHAVQWSGSNWHSMLEFAGKERVSTNGDELFFVQENELSVVVPEGAWIVRSAISPKWFTMISNDLMEEAYVDDDQEAK